MCHGVLELQIELTGSSRSMTPTLRWENGFSHLGIYFETKTKVRFYGPSTT